MTLMGERERISAERAERIGIVTQVVPAADLMTVAQGIAATIASFPVAAVQASLRAVWAASELPPAQMDSLGNLFLNLAMTAEALRDGQEVFLGRTPQPPTVR